MLFELVNHLFQLVIDRIVKVTDEKMLDFSPIQIYESLDSLLGMNLMSVKTRVTSTFVSLKNYHFLLVDSVVY